MVKCKICGNLATGFNYGVESCYGCKSFYKRGTTRAAEYKCFFGRKCYDGGIAVRSCKACRFQRCLQLGMSHGGLRKIDEPIQCIRQDYRAPSANPYGIYHQNQFRYPTRPRLGGVAVPAVVSDSVRISQTDGTRKAADERTTVLRRIQPVEEIDLTKSEPERPSVIKRTENRFLISDLKDNERSESLVSLASLVKFRIFDMETVDLRDSPSLTGITSDACVPMTRCFDPEKYRVMPTFLEDYRRAGRHKALQVNNTTLAILDAMDRSYGDMIAAWSNFRTTVRLYGKVPPRPNTSLEFITESTRVSIAGFFRRVRRFAYLLPGFVEFDQSDQEILLREKFAEMYLICFAPYLRDGEWHILIGPKADIHLSQYWMRQILSPDHYELTLQLAAVVNNIQLTQVELFLLLAVTTFQPEFTTAKNKSLLSVLCHHYQDCLISSIRCRCTPAEQMNIEAKLRNFTSLFRSLYRWGNFYIRLTDFGQVPFKAVLGSSTLSIEQALTVKEDGLQPVSDV